MCCNLTSTQVEPGLRLVKDESEKSVDSTLFKQVVGSLRYLYNTRPGISFAVGLISRFLDDPKAFHWATAKRILRYLRGTLSYGVLFPKKSYQTALTSLVGISESTTMLMGFSDSDWCGDKVERKSTTGYLLKFLGTPISWCSKKQPVMTLSSCEAEYIVACYVACQALWLDFLLEELKIEIHRPIEMYVDNKSIINLAMNPVAHGSTEMQLVDILTKGLKVNSFIVLRDKLGVSSIEILN
ncbi:secreted RxLR effector protein 161-like [Glycine max]|uniref:secreted RxLR effector protein 161-like n=1 Tax=Glycine max TaxID=3847 RepID=UPI001B357467|nr:secreted RxLR effector protein 161-like [Glycine max]